MIVFWILLFVPILIQHISITEHYIDYQRRNRVALGFFFLLLTVLVMFRHESVGNDTRNYIFYFDKIAKTEWRALGEAKIEIGYVYFNKLVSLISEEPRFFFAIAAALVSAMIYPTYKRLCSDATLTVVLFCIMSTFVMLFSGIRQMLAIGIGFVAYDFTRKKKLIPFVLAVLLACMFHASAFMLVFMYPLYYVRITKKWLYAVIPAMVVLFVFNRQFFAGLSVILSRYTRFEGEIESTGAYTMILLFAAFAVFSFVIPDEKKLDQEVIGMRNFLLLSLAMQMFAPLHTLAMRMNYYYIIFIPLLLPKIIECRRKRWSRVALLGRHIMVIVFLLYFFMNARNYNGNLHVFPYHFFWERII